MQNQTLLTILVAGAAGVLASAAVSLSLIPTEVEGSDLVASTPGELDGDASLVSREDMEEHLQSLRAENQMLANRIGELERARVWAENRREAVEPEALAESRTDEEMIKDGLAALTGTNGSLPPNIENGMRRAFEDFRDEERVESEQRWADARQKELDTRIERYAEELNLDSFQTEEMRTLLTDEQVRRGDLMTAAREDGTWETLREDVRTIRDETREGLALVLTPEQMDQYDQSSRGGRGRGDFGGGAGGGGGRRDR